jgi:peptidyl-prolyl cis-trans isomerase C
MIVWQTIPLIMIINVMSLPGKILIPFLFCGVLFFFGCDNRQEAKPSAPLVVINNQEISKVAFLKEFNRSLQKDQPLTGIEKEELKRSFLVQLIDRELIHDEARRQNIEVSDADIDTALQSFRQDYSGTSFESLLQERGLTLEAWRDELKESLIMEKLLEQAVYSKIDVSEEEVETYFKANRDQFNRPEQVRARQIVVSDEAMGQQALAELRQGTPFEDVAKKYSLSPDAQKGGDLGFFARGEMPPEFDAVAFDLPIGRLSELIQSEYGYHIFLVEEKRKAARMKKKDVEPEIRDIIEGQKKEDFYLDWLQNVRARAVIQVDWDQLEDLDAYK